MTWPAFEQFYLLALYGRLIVFSIETLPVLLAKFFRNDTAKNGNLGSVPLELFIKHKGKKWQNFPNLKYPINRTFLRGNKNDCLMIRYTYSLKDYRSLLKGLARQLQLPVIEKKMEIPQSLGEGYIYASNINQDISYFIMDVKLKDDLVFLRKKSAEYGLSLIFSQVDVSDFFKMREQQETIIDKSPKRSNIFLSSTNYEIETTYSKQSKLKIAGIFFSPFFIQRCIKKDILLDIMMYTGQRLRNLNKEPITFE